MKLETLNLVVPDLRDALEELNDKIENGDQFAWSITAKVQAKGERWDVKLDREGHVTVQRQS